MQGYNAIAIFSEDTLQVLMCKRRKRPYKGLSNFVGGKIEANESGLTAAYRELQEETGITPDDVLLSHLMSFTYPLDHCYLEVYVGKLKHSVTVAGDENELYWSSLDHDFFDASKYAGEGNIGHMMMHIAMHREEVLK
ncbi:MAG: NUDIX domain-containing protein [Clostridia bacterium]|nr:NUDIX domain-containing protein [Clostridia bacterium]